MADEGDDMNEGKAGEEGGKGSELSPEIKAIQESVTGLAETVTQLAEAGKANNEAILKMAKDQADKIAADAIAAEDAENTVSDDDLETMDRSAFKNHLVSEIVKQIDTTIIEPLKKDISATRGAAQQSELKLALKQAIEDHKDFEEWKPEISALAKEKPYLTIDEMYILARSKNATKAREMDKKYEKEENTDDAGDKGKTKKKPYGGLPPSSGKTESVTTMSKEDAIDKAWEETMEEVEAAGILSGNP